MVASNPCVMPMCKTPKGNAQQDIDPVLARREHQVDDDQYGQPDGQERPVAHAIGELAKRVCRQRVDDVHRHHVLYLGVHFLSDTLGELAEAAAWLALSLTVLHGRVGRAAVDRLFPSKAR